MNWRPKEPASGSVRGEIDVVAERDGLLVFCEVKARADEQWGHPAEALTESKAATVRATAARFLREHGAGGTRVRFDLAVVIGRSIEIWPDAF